MQDESSTTENTIFEREDGRQIESLVLNELDLTDLPTSQTACQVCPNVVWLEQTDNGQKFPKAYCRVMNTIIWSPQEPVEITNCDGLLIGVEEAEAGGEIPMDTALAPDFEPDMDFTPVD
ncbi:hypothetical protein RGG33_004421 [Vibrio parahaemolyticus]|nr:hypothetical protein [Vibrio parahaemolyticus]ELA6925073.1 hypothetical protein [Vibrio parahaemolyticus]